MKTSTIVRVTCALLVSILSAHSEEKKPLSPEPGKEFSLISAVPGGEARRLERQQKFLDRQSQDKRTFSAAILKEIEDLYQSQNLKKNSSEAKTSLEKLVNDSRFEKSNRVGCALVYLATTDNPEKVEDRLKLAIEKYSDCWYGDGVNVGALARLRLGEYYYRNGKKDEANKLFKELKQNYSDAIGHAGEILVDTIPSGMAE